MYNKTKFPYKFKYLKTGITGDGIKNVYLPDPVDYEVLFKKEDKFIRTELPADWKKWVREEAKKKVNEPEYNHPQITEFVNTEWDRRLRGIYFMNKGKLTYMTGNHYWAVCWLNFNFGHMSYREPDKEIYYFAKYCEEDPLSFGLALVTIRRYGKSTIMGGWALDPVLRTRQFFVGMQGENDLKIASFYRKNILYPFERLKSFWMPTFINENSTNKKSIELIKTPTRGKVHQDDDADDALDSLIDYRNSGSFMYDSEKLHRYIMEEAGKIEKEDIQERWEVVKPCLSNGIDIIGKAFLASTVELMKLANKGGKAFETLYYDSDVDAREEDGQTSSGLYACWLPGDCALEGCFDEHGYPDRKAAKNWILTDRKKYEKKSADLKAGRIRKYFLNLEEAFWVENELCPFNVNILNERYGELLKMENVVTRGKLVWENNIRSTKVVFQPDPNGKFAAHYIPSKEEDLNQVKKAGILIDATGNPQQQYAPMMGDSYHLGADTIQNRVEEGARKSRPVTFAKLKYDVAIDGQFDLDLLKQRAEEKYQYKTNRYFMMYDKRPSEPTVYYEDMLMMAWFLGAPIHFENQKSAIIDYFYIHGMKQFVMSKFSTFTDVPTKVAESLPGGTHSSAPVIESYTNYYATYIEYFGHTIPFIDQVNDARQFNPNKPTKHDHTVAAGFTELAGVNRRVYTPKPIDLEDLFPSFQNN